MKPGGRRRAGDRDPIGARRGPAEDLDSRAGSGLDSTPGILVSAVERRLHARIAVARPIGSGEVALNIISLAT